MNDDDIKAAKERALKWVTRRDSTVITRDEALGEELLALDVLVCIEEIERQKELLRVWTS